MTKRELETHTLKHTHTHTHTEREREREREIRNTGREADNMVKGMV